MKHHYEIYSIKKREKRLKEYKKLVQKIFDLRAMDLSFAEIAKELGMKSRTQTHAMFKANQ